MSLLPDYSFNSVTEIPVSFFKEKGIKGIAIDVDNTLTGDGSQYLHEEIREWVEQVKKAGLKLCAVSNNDRERLQPFAETIGIPYIFEAKKPSPRCIKKVLGILGTDKSETAMIGDQYFTDMLFAYRVRLTSILINPLGDDNHSGATVKRFFEKPIRRMIRRKKENE